MGALLGAVALAVGLPQGVGLSGLTCEVSRAWAAVDEAALDVPADLGTRAVVIEHRCGAWVGPPGSSVDLTVGDGVLAQGIRVIGVRRAQGSVILGLSEDQAAAVRSEHLDSARVHHDTEAWLALFAELDHARRR